MPMKVKDVTCDILDIDIGEDPIACVVTSQCSCRTGVAWGFLTHTESTSGSACLSAAALTEKALQRGNPTFLPFSGPSGGLLQDTCAEPRDGRLFGSSKRSVALIQNRAMPLCSSHAFASWPKKRARRFKNRQHAQMQK